jgi:hypothetical protein
MGEHTSKYYKILIVFNGRDKLLGFFLVKSIYLDIISDGHHYRQKFVGNLNYQLRYKFSRGSFIGAIFTRTI